MNAQSPVPMGRKRTRDFDLPPRLHRRASSRGDRYYYVTHDRRWIPLGDNLARARRLWADYECLGTDGTVAALVDRYVADCMDKRAPATRKQYRAFARTVSAQWGTIPADSLQPWQIAQWRDQRGIGQGWANGVISLLRVAYAKGLEWGWVASNPATAVAFNAMPVRETYLTDVQFRAIRAAAPRWLALTMDLDYLTALRESDLVRLRWEDVSDVLPVRVQKTRVRLAVRVTDEVRSVLEQARQRPILGLYVVATDRGRPVTVRRIQDAWRTACAAAGVSGAQFRDIRAKAATDAEQIGIDHQRLLGHSSRRMSDRYLKLRRTIIAEPMRGKL